MEPAAESAELPREGALGDLKVLDLSTGPASAYCTKWFADFGAEVVLVEDPDRPSEVRRRPPLLDDRPTAQSAGHVYLNAGKKSIGISLRSEQGQSLIHRLVRQVDLVVEDAAPGAMNELGLGFESLKQHNPGLIYLSITPFGQTGPYRDYPATELTLAAWSGTLGVRRIAGRRPVDMGCHQGSYIGGRVAFIAAMGAVLHRRHHPDGQQVDVALLEALAGNDMAAPTTYSYNGIDLPAPAEAAPRGRGGQGTYPCKDGDVNVLPGIGGMKKLAALLGDPGLADHELFRDHALRARRADEFDQVFLLPYLAKHTRAEVVEAAQNQGMPFSYLLHPEELIDEPQLIARGLFAHPSNPDDELIRVPGPPVRMSRTNPSNRGSAPHPGESTRDILRDWLQVSAAEAEELAAGSVLDRE